MVEVLLAPRAEQPRPPLLRWRYVICVLIFFVTLIANAERTNIGIVLAQYSFPGIARDARGNILSAFFVGYSLTQILGGVLARRFGSKPALLLAVTVWATCDALTPFAADLGMAALVLDRVSMGLGEGMLYPCQHALSAFWVPREERAFLIVFMMSGQDIGAVIANLVTPHLLKVGAWTVFVGWGGLALLWCAVYAGLGASAPECHGPCIRTGEAEWIRLRRGAAHFDVACQQGAAPCPGRLLRAPCIWGIFVGHVGVAYAWYVLLSWMPTFFRAVHHLDLAASPALLAGPYLGGWAGGLVAGRVSDALVARGFRTRRVRKFMQVFGAVSSALVVQLAVFSESAVAAALWLSLSTLCSKIQNAGYTVSMVDVCPETAGTVMGLSNTIATLTGIVGQPITHAILQECGGDHSREAWAGAFGVGGAVAVAAAVVFAALGDDVSLDSPSRCTSYADSGVEVASFGII